jgi:glycosyltransferase involved in cell wall biosynthesis
MDTNMTPAVSVILPTYNGAAYIAAAIASVQVQSYTNWELIIIDDGSTDGTDALIQPLIRADNRIQYIKNEQNLGIQKALNQGIALAKGEYIARIDDDDRWIDAAKLENQVARFESEQDLVLLGTGAILIDDTEHQIGKYTLVESDGAIRNRILSKNCFVHSSVMFRAEAARTVGGYSGEVYARHVEDHELWLRLGTIGRLANIARPAVALMIRSATLTARYRVTQACNMLRLAWKYRQGYPRFFVAMAVCLTRLAFFGIQKIIPLPKKLVYKIQAIYRKI